MRKRAHRHFETREPGIACWLERQTCDRKVASSNPGWSGGRIFFSRVNFVCRLLFGVRSTPVPVTAVALKRPRSFRQSAGGRLHLNTHTSLTQRSRNGLTVLSRHNVGSYQGNELTRHSSENTRPQSSQHAEPLWTDLVLKSKIDVRELIFT